MTCSQPLVSVLMTAYNREKYIGEAIESVLSSCYSNFELIIVDDGSTDKTIEIVREYACKDNRIRVYINEINLGDYPNRNKAASFALGKYIKYLDSDDMMYSYTLTAMVKFMEKYPLAAMAVSANSPNTINPFPYYLTPEKSLRHHFFNQNFLDSAPTSSIILKNAFDSLNHFSGKRMIGDVEFGLKCAATYPVLIIPPGLIFWRYHGDQEVCIGIKKNMYPSMMKEVLGNFFKTISFDILSLIERNQILKKQFESQSLKGIIKRYVKVFYKKLF